MAAINQLISFIVDNIAVITGVLVVLFSMVSSMKKKRRAAEAETENDEAPRKKSFRDLMAEMEAELDKENGEGKETQHPYKPQQAEAADPRRERPAMKREESPWERQPAPELTRRQTPSVSRQKESPWNRQPAPAVKPKEALREQSSDEGVSLEYANFVAATAPPAKDVLQDVTPGMAAQTETATGGNIVFPVGNLSDLAKAVVMSEIIGKPKALR